MSHHTALLVGIGRAIADAGLGNYREDGHYSEGERGILISAFPETPQEIISISLYLPEYTVLSPSAPHQLTASRVQIKYRLTGNPLAGVHLFDKLQGLFHGNRLNLAGIRANGEFLSYGSLGQDANSRWLSTTNFRFSGLEIRP